MISVKVNEAVAASADAVWALLRDFGGIQRFSSGIESCTVEGAGVGAVRTITMPGGVQIQERLEAFDDSARSLSYAIVAGPIPVTNYLSSIHVSEDGEGCTIAWGSDFESSLPADQARGMIEGIYTGSIAGIKKTLGV